MAYPYTEEDYAKLLRKAAQETRAAMILSEMLDDVRPKRIPTEDRAKNLLRVIRKSDQPLTVAEMADLSGTVAIKPLQTALRHLVSRGDVAQTEIVRDRRHGGAPVVTYAPAGDRHV